MKIQIAPTCIAVFAAIFLNSHPVLADEAEWKAKMSDLATAFTDLTGLIFKESNDEADLVPLRESVAKVHSISKRLDQGFSHAVKPGDLDPTIHIIAQKFRSDIDLAQESLMRGDQRFSKQIMRGTIAYCVSCHTRGAVGPQFPLIKAFQKNMSNLPWADQIGLQVATRQYDTAFEGVLRMLERPVKMAKPLDIEKATRTALSVAVRVKENPDKVIALANAVKKSTQASVSLKADAEVWLKDATAWRTEKKSSLTDADLIAVAKTLINEEADSSTWIPHAEVRYLRASNLMHSHLRRFPKSRNIGESLYIIGVSYDVLRDLGLWNLHESYYRACIHKAPHSEIAMKCYKRLEESVVAGFTGSMGTSVPSAVRDHLRDLKIQAQ